MATAAHTIYQNRFARRLARLAANRRLVDVVYSTALVTLGSRSPRVQGCTAPSFSRARA